MSFFVYIFAMAVVTYLIRMIPFTIFRKQIQSTFILSLLYYLPYAVLSAMTFPAIFYSTGNTLTATVGTITALILAYLKQPLIIVALAAAGAALITGLII